MDNFSTWVDAPSEALIPTPIEDESNNYLRDEILQIQQFVIDKLDEQKINDTEDEDRSMDDSVLALRVLDDMRVEARRSEAVRQTMLGYQRDCKKNELQVIALKQNLPRGHVEPLNHDKLISDMNHDVARLRDQLDTREIELQKRQQSMPKHQRDAEKATLMKMRVSYVESKRKHEQLHAIEFSVSELLKEHDLALKRRAQESRELEMAQEALKAEEDALEKLNDENASMRAQLVQMESARSTKGFDARDSEFGRVAAESQLIRQETGECQLKTEILHEQTAQLQMKIDGMENEELEKRVDDKLKALVKALRQKFNDAKESAKNEDVRRTILKLKVAIGEEEAKLEKAREEAKKALPGKSKNMAELKKLISTMEADHRSQDTKIKEAVKENDELLNEIAKHTVPSDDSMDFLDQTVDIAPHKKSDVTLDIPPADSAASWKSAPRLPLDVTPIHAPQPREKSVEVPPVKEWMTSTPLHKTRKQKSPVKPEKQKPPAKNVRTRGAARRLAETQPAPAAKTEKPRKKRGKN